MVKKDFMFAGLLLLVVSAGVLIISSGPKGATRKDTKEADQAIAEAKGLYRVSIKSGWDLTSGPCLSNDLMPNWVADLVHNPRTSEDDIRANQCPAYLEGRAQHYVELDLGGNVVSIK